MAGKREVLLTDEQWEMVKPFNPEVPTTRRGGRPRADDQACFEGILWVLRSGARWKDLPDWYPSPSTCWRRLAEWEGAGVFVDMWHAFIDELDEQGCINWDEVFMDGSFAPAKKGATTWVKPNVEKVQSGWWWQMAKEYLWHVPSTRHRKRK